MSVRWRAVMALVLPVALMACSTLSVAEERKLGRRFERKIREEYRFVHDRVVMGYVHDVGTRLRKATPPQPFDIELHVVWDEHINAFAAPAGKIYIHTATITQSDTVAELAGVIAHEIGHVAHRHIAENYKRQQTATGVQAAVVIGTGVLAGGQAAQAAGALSNIGLLATLNKFSREDEREADDFAVSILPEARYDPRGLPSFFEKLAATDRGRGPTFLASHPAPTARMRATRAAIVDMDLPADLIRKDGRLPAIKKRLRALARGEPVPSRPTSGGPRHPPDASVPSPPGASKR